MGDESMRSGRDDGLEADAMAGYSLILFDLDGTLTDPKVGITKSVQYALAKLGIDPPGSEELTSFIGPPLHVTFAERYRLDPAAVSQAIAYYREYFAARGMYENLVYDGVPALLEELSRASRRLVVATSKPTVFAESILEHFGIRAVFDYVVGSHLDGTRSAKTDVIAEALRRYPDIRDRVMVGDRAHDVVGAKNNRIDSIGVSYGYGSRAELVEANPTYLVDTVAEIGRLVRGAPGKMG
jgi:phosphoglycolate phosphatase